LIKFGGMALPDEASDRAVSNVNGFVVAGLILATLLMEEVAWIGVFTLGGGRKLFGWLVASWAMAKHLLAKPNLCIRGMLPK
jgi:hypothetical protein